MSTSPKIPDTRPRGISLTEGETAQRPRPARGPDAPAPRRVRILTGCRLHFVFAGMERLAVTRGDAVAPGQTLGHLPAGGSELTPVLHVELHKSGKRVDPGPDISGP